MRNLTTLAQTYRSADCGTLESVRALKQLHDAAYRNPKPVVSLLWELGEELSGEKETLVMTLLEVLDQNQKLKPTKKAKPVVRVFDTADKAQASPSEPQKPTQTTPKAETPTPIKEKQVRPRKHTKPALRIRRAGKSTYRLAVAGRVDQLKRDGYPESDIQLSGGTGFFRKYEAYVNQNIYAKSLEERDNLKTLVSIFRELINTQSEDISDVVIPHLKARFKELNVAWDNDVAGWVFNRVQHQDHLWKLPATQQ